MCQISHIFLFSNSKIYLLEEAVDLEAADSASSVAVKAGEDGEGLEVRVAGEGLSLALNLDLLLGDGLEKVFQLKLGLNSNHLKFYFQLYL